MKTVGSLVCFMRCGVICCAFVCHVGNHAGDLALLYESWWKTRRSIIWTIAPDRREEEKKVLFDRSAGRVPLLLAAANAWRCTCEATTQGYQALHMIPENLDDMHLRVRSTAQLHVACQHAYWDTAQVWMPTQPIRNI